MLFRRAQDERLACREHRGSQALPQRKRAGNRLVSLIHVIGKAKQLLGGIELRDVDGVGGEDLADLFSHQADDGLKVELRRQAFLHAVDDGQFRGALLLGFEQALGLAEEPRILERHAHGRPRWSAAGGHSPR